MTKVGSVYRIEIVQTLAQANKPTAETAKDLEALVREHVPDLVDTKVSELYERITLFDESRDTHETRSQEEP